MTRITQARVDDLNKQRLSLIHPVVRARAGDFLTLSRTELKLVVFVISGFRTFEEQQKIYAKGRYGPEKDKPRVTRACPGQSYHNYGLACDVIPLRRLTERMFELTWSDEEFLGPAYRRIRALARKVGFETIRNDRPHLQWRNTWHWSQLFAKGYGCSRPIGEIDLADW
jgi:hypothetical protein